MATARKALVIEDRDDWRAQLTRLLERKGLEVRAVETEDKARGVLESTKAIDRGFEIIVLDLRLVEWRHEFEGMELLALTDARAEAENSKVIIVTAHGTVMEAREAFGQHKVFDFMPKTSDDPNFDFYELFQAAIDKAAKEHHAERHSDV